jgi:folate-binding Fe-S cluster repair protein YgfZ
MEHRGTARNRVVPVAIAGPPPAPGSDIMAGDRPAGRMGSSAGTQGLALLRLDRAAGTRLSAGASTLTAQQPAWARFRVDGTAPREAS